MDGKIKIAIVDDHRVFREGVRTLLSLEGDLEVVGSGSDGSEALQLLDDCRPDVLLLDLHMPNMGGLETLQLLFAREGSVRVIVMTASDDPGEYVEAITAGASAVILKQSATERLIDCIRRIHAGEMWVDSEALPLPV